MLEVLVVAAVAALIAASIIRSRLQPALTAAGQVQIVRDDLSGQGALARVRQVWMSGGTCSSSASAGVVCSGSGCSCSCTVAGLGSVASVRKGGACSLTAWQ